MKLWQPVRGTVMLEENRRGGDCRPCQRRFGSIAQQREFRLTRICIIGDSHIGALLSAWRKNQDLFPGLALTGFGAPKTLFDALEVRDGTLVPPTDQVANYFKHTSGGETAVAGDFDAYLMCGMDWALRLVLPAVGKYRTPEQHADWREIISSAAYAQIMRSRLSDSMAARLFGKLRAITRARIAIAPAPMITETAPLPIYERMRQRGEMHYIAASFDSAARIVAAELGAEYLPQPPTTLSNPLQTLDRYRRGSTRTFQGNLDIVRDDDDYQHMNADYGLLVLRDFLGQPSDQAAARARS